jgi:hypothetical protein
MRAGEAVFPDVQAGTVLPLGHVQDLSASVRPQVSEALSIPGDDLSTHVAEAISKLGADARGKAVSAALRALPR